MELVKLIRKYCAIRKTTEWYQIIIYVASLLHLRNMNKELAAELPVSILVDLIYAECIFVCAYK